jgi:hypothetical protein
MIYCIYVNIIHGFLYTAIESTLKLHAHLWLGKNAAHFFPSICTPAETTDSNVSGITGSYLKAPSLHALIIRDSNPVELPILLLTYMHTSRETKSRSQFPYRRKTLPSMRCLEKVDGVPGSAAMWRDIQIGQSA